MSAPDPFLSTLSHEQRERLAAIEAMPDRAEGERLSLQFVLMLTPSQYELLRKR